MTTLKQAREGLKDKRKAKKMGFKQEASVYIGAANEETPVKLVPKIIQKLTKKGN